MSQNSHIHTPLSAIREDGALRIGRVQCHGTAEIEVATLAGMGCRDVLIGDLRMSKNRARLLINLLQTAVDEG